MNTEKPSIRVLIVDDMAQVRRDLRTVLPLFGESAGIPIQVVGEAADGQEAIQLAQVLQPDTVLIDLIMPVMDGFAAAREIKAADPNIWVIALSIHSSQESRAAAFQAGADRFIEKGRPLEEILQAIGSCRCTKS